MENEDKEVVVDFVFCYLCDKLVTVDQVLKLHGEEVCKECYDYEWNLAMANECFDNLN